MLAGSVAAMNTAYYAIVCVCVRERVGERDALRIARTFSLSTKYVWVYECPQCMLVLERELASVYCESGASVLNTEAFRIHYSLFEQIWQIYTLEL